MLAVTAVVAGLVAGGGFATTAAGDSPSLGAAKVARVAGSDRYATAIAISKHWYPAITDARHPKEVFLASGATYADALSVAPVAARSASPVLLTPPDNLRADVLAEIQRLGAGKVTIVGGPGAVSANVESQLKAAQIPVVNRVGGKDRYETSRAVVQYGLQYEMLGIPDPLFDANTTNVFIATGRDYPDALSAAALAGWLAAPVILEDGKAGQLSAQGAALLAQFPNAVVTVVGGPGAVSDGLYESVPGDNKQRVAGPSRYATSQALLTQLDITQDFPTVGLFATGTNFPDALAGAAFAGALHNPLWIVPPNGVPAAVADQAAKWGMNTDKTTFVLLGGTAALSPAFDALTIIP
jgi:putative cell wall-binding protein